MLKGHKTNLELCEKDDLTLIKQWVNDVDFNGEFEPFEQLTLADLEKQYESKAESQWFLILTLDGTKIGYIAHFKSKGCIAIGYMLVPEGRGKGYGSEAVQIMVDYLFLHKDTVRIQAETHPDNIPSQKVLLRAGFKKEGVIRKSFFSRGVYRDTALYGLLREEWRAPRILPPGHVSKA